MTRLRPKERTIKALFAKSGNQCAFPSCKEQLTHNKDQIIGQLCHIEAANKNGPRFNPNSNNEYRRSYKNLILLCPTHHCKIDKLNQFSAKDLKKMKINHEKEFERSSFHINDEALTKFMNEMDRYWIDTEKINRDWQSKLSLAMDIDVKRDYFQAMNNMRALINNVEDAFQALHESDRNLWNEIKEFLKKNGISKKLLKGVKYRDNPFINRNWEIHNLKVNNVLKKLRVDIIYIEIKFLEEFLKYNPNHNKAKLILEDRKKSFKDIAQTATYTD